MSLLERAQLYRERAAKAQTEAVCLSLLALAEELEELHEYLSQKGGSDNA